MKPYKMATPQEKAQCVSWFKLIFRLWALKEFQRRYWPVKVGFL